VKILGFALLVAAAAPMQCQSDPPSEERRYEHPPEALYALAGRLHREGETRAWRITLQTIVERYPNSREAVMAKDDLEQSDAARAPAEATPDP
jgi:hypothetical protein